MPRRNLPWNLAHIFLTPYTTFIQPSLFNTRTRNLVSIVLWLIIHDTVQTDIQFCSSEHDRERFKLFDYTWIVTRAPAESVIPFSVSNILTLQWFPTVMIITVHLTIRNVEKIQFLTQHLWNHTNCRKHVCPYVSFKVRLDSSLVLILTRIFNVWVFVIITISANQWIKKIVTILPKPNWLHDHCGMHVCLCYETLHRSFFENELYPTVYCPSNPDKNWFCIHWRQVKNN